MERLEDMDKQLDFETRLSLAFDPRLLDVWAAAERCDLDLDQVGGAVGLLLRMAYLRGYEDALFEEERGLLFHRLGVPVPPRPPRQVRSGGRGSRR